MRHALPTIAVAAVLIAGCASVATNTDRLDGPTTTIAIATGSDEIATLGVPFVEGVPVVETVGVAITALDDLLGPIDLRFSYVDGTYRYDPDGLVATIAFPFQGSVDVALPAGREYGFETYGEDGDERWLAYGRSVAHVDFTTTTVALGLETMIEGATLDTTTPTSAIVPGQTADLYLEVRAPGGYAVPVADYAVVYAIAPADGTIGAISQVGTRAVATAAPTDDTFTLTATVTGWRDVAGVATRSDVTTTFEAPYAIASGLGLDTSAPVVTIDATTATTVGVAYVLGGSASDDVALDRVQVYEGPVLVGSSDPVESDLEGVGTVALGAGTWTLSWTPTEVRSHTITVVAIDTAGNDRRADAILEVEAAPLALETLANWWATTSVVDLRSFGTMRVQVTFEYSGVDPITFTGAGGGADPVAELQYWTNPSVATPPAVAHAFPQGTYGLGDTLTWDVTFDVSGLDAADTGIALRPQPSGTLGPNLLSMVAESVTLGD